MALPNLTTDSFRSNTDKGIVLIDFWAAWCGPCRAFAPAFERAAGRHPDVTFAKVDTEAEPGLAALFNIRSIPTVVVLRDGIVLGAFPGALPTDALDDLVREARALDMDEVRREIGAANSGALQPA